MIKMKSLEPLLLLRSRPFLRGFYCKSQVTNGTFLVKFHLKHAPHFLFKHMSFNYYYNHILSDFQYKKLLGHIL